MEKPFLIFLLVMVLAGCSRPMSCDRLMDRADSLTAAGDDSSVWAAKALLDSGGSRAATLPTAQRMRYRLLYARVMNKACIPFTTDSVVKAVAGWYALHGTPNERMEAWYLLGCAYRDLGDAPRAIVALNKAEACADTLARDCDYKTLSRICSQRDCLYVGMNMPHTRLAEIDKGVRYAMLARDTMGAIALYNQKSTVYDLLGKTDSSILVNENAARMFNQMGRHDYAAMAVGANIDNYIRKGRPSDAWKAIETYEREAGVFKDGEIEEGREYFYNLKGSYYLAIHQMDSAEHYFRKQMQAGMDENNQHAASQSLARLYGEKGLSDSTAKYAYRAMAYSDSLNRHVKTEEIFHANNTYNYSSSKASAENEHKENTGLKRMLLLTGAVSVVMMLFLVLAYYRKKSRDERKHAELREQYMETLAELENKKRALEKKQELAERHSKEENYIKQIEEKKRQILELESKVEEYDKRMSALRNKHLEEDLRATSAYKRFEQLCRTAKKPSRHDWEDLAETLQAMIPGFYEIVCSHSKLSENEYKVCILSRFGFRPTDISNLLGGAFSNISVARARLLAKVFGIEGTAREFDRRIMQIR